MDYIAANVAYRYCKPINSNNNKNNINDNNNNNT